ncbi:MAG: hypothetical protein K9N23_13765 [Akkermansiaceae bacterium]|nr:hypothetical protein [Akkermansiaceae bacterium]MCF7732751.1 hypothetical protein [Akkermansiaceae bacterium]
MNSRLTLPNQKVSVSRLGMCINGNLSIEEWQELATSIGELATSIAFIVGDWLVYGQGLFGKDGYPDKKVDHPSYQLALKATGLDLSTLQNYAYVSRSVPYSLRSERLSWEHHRLLAKLPDADMQGWIKTCEAEEDAGRRISTRRLRKSLSLGRVATAADLQPDDSDNGQENHIPLVNRFCGWWRRLQTSRFLATATREQRAAMKRDLEPIINIYNQL